MLKRRQTTLHLGRAPAELALIIVSASSIRCAVCIPPTLILSITNITKWISGKTNVVAYLLSRLCISQAREVAP
jgi:hypothetical protein